MNTIQVKKIACLAIWLRLRLRSSRVLRWMRQSECSISFGLQPGYGHHSIVCWPAGDHDRRSVASSSWVVPFSSDQSGSTTVLDGQVLKGEVVKRDLASSDVACRSWRILEVDWTAFWLRRLKWSHSSGCPGSFLGIGCRRHQASFLGLFLGSKFHSRRAGLTVHLSCRNVALILMWFILPGIEKTLTLKSMEGFSFYFCLSPVCLPAIDRSQARNRRLCRVTVTDIGEFAPAITLRGWGLLKCVVALHICGALCRWTPHQKTTFFWRSLRCSKQSSTVVKCCALGSWGMHWLCCVGFLFILHVQRGHILIILQIYI